MRVRLTHKLADVLDGIDVSHYRIGDVLTLPDRQADLLIAEGWAVVNVSAQPRRHHPNRTARERSTSLIRAEAGAGSRRPGINEQLRHVRNQMEHRRFAPNEHRRAEDRIRDELQDSRAKTLRQLDRGE